MAELNSSVVPTASNTWSSLGLLSPVKVLENPVKKCVATQIKIFFSLVCTFLENFLLEV